MKHSSTDSGAYGEQIAAEYLVDLGYEIIARNYRRPHCEIDIIARRDDVLYFVEVKYRRTNGYGDGLSYVTPAKVLHMQRGAQSWVTSHGYSGEYCLSAIAVEGDDYTVTSFIESVY